MACFSLVGRTINIQKGMCNNIMKSVSRRKLIPIILFTIIAMVFLSTTLFSDWIDPNAGGGGGAIDEGGSWSLAYQGLMVTVVNKEGNTVAGPLTFTYSNIAGNVIMSWKNKMGVSSGTQCVALSSKWPTPIISSGDGFTGNGEAIREFLVTQKNNMDDLLKPMNYSVDQLIEDDNKVLVEPVFWMTPITRTGQYFSQPLGGTISQLAKWHYDNRAVLGNSIGGRMANLIADVGPVCMHTVKLDDELGIVPPSKLSGYQSLPEVYNPSIGYGLHIYTPNDFGNGPKKVIKVYYDADKNYERTTEGPIDSGATSYTATDESKYKHTASFWSSYYIPKSKINSWEDACKAQPQFQYWSGNGGSSTKNWKADEKSVTVYVK